MRTEFNMPVFRQVWLLSFGDLLTLMLCFFIAICSTNRFQDNSIQQLTSSNNSLTSDKEHRLMDKSQNGTGIAGSLKDTDTPTAVLTSKDYKPNVGFSAESLKRLFVSLQDGLDQKKTYVLEICSRPAVGSVQSEKLSWEDALSKLQVLKDHLRKNGFSKLIEQTRVLGPYCELLKGTEKDRFVSFSLLQK